MKSRGLLLLAAALRLLLAAAVAAPAQRLRHVAGADGAKDKAKEIPGWGQPRWGGRSFGDSVASNNIWGQSRPMPMVEDMHPTAPMDRIDKHWSDSFTGAVAHSPTDERADGYSPFLRVAYQHDIDKPRVFPGDGNGYQGYDQPGIHGSPQTPMEERHLYAVGDQVWPGPQTPITAPANEQVSARGTGLNMPIAPQDRLPEKFAGYLDQVHGQEARRQENMRLKGMFDRADTNLDGSISKEEFEGELKGVQNKTQEEVESLWGKYHLADAGGTGSGEGVTGMDLEEFSRLAMTGFDLGGLTGREANEFKGVSSVLTLPDAPRLGFWGSGARCPSGSFMTGARLKVMPLSQTEDNTALNGVELECSSGETSKTIEGGDGSWTDWGKCPEGQRVYGFRARMQSRRSMARDNTGLLDLEFGCRAQDLSSFTKLRYGSDVAKAPNTVVASGPSAVGGGWTHELMCGPSAAVCGMQANVVRFTAQSASSPQGKDDMGLADLRVYCCAAPVDCSSACGKPEGTVSIQCRVCRRAAGLA
mmetsp:Transcript_15767/g.47305  ORF Transcript_15767/g.47305 Transcript_15767/m.47305 type:complete len:532 (+) Transcript_15767:182-1777(+)